MLGACARRCDVGGSTSPSGAPPLRAYSPYCSAVKAVTHYGPADRLGQHRICERHGSRSDWCDGSLSPSGCVVGPGTDVVGRGTAALTIGSLTGMTCGCRGRPTPLSRIGQLRRGSSFVECRSPIGCCERFFYRGPLVSVVVVGRTRDGPAGSRRTRAANASRRPRLDDRTFGRGKR